ncbi:YrhC family protein [Cytobacillus suaedae]|nr:YrhC family protein [Cytobacillus suaedae]
MNTNLLAYVIVLLAIKKRGAVVDKNKVKVIQGKVTDYTQFGFILLAVSVFLYIGMLIPSEGIHSLQTNLLMGATVLFLILSFYFFRKVIKYKQILSSEEQQ